MHRHIITLVSLIALACGCSSGGSPSATAGSTGTTGSLTASSAGSGTSGGRAPSSSTSGTTSGAPFPEAPHNPFPQVPYQGGFTNSAPGVWTISFSDDQWAADEVAWAKWVVGSPWLSQVGAEYGVGNGTFLGSVALTQPAPKVSQDSDVQNLLSGLFADKTLPAPPVDRSAIYIVHYPYGASLTGPPGTGQSCTEFGGYHYSFDYEQTSVIYAVVVDCGGGTGPNPPDPAEIEIAASHELMEAATDPYGAQYLATGDPTYAGWVLDLTDETDPWFAVGPELGDLCSWATFEDVDAGFWAQRIYSNAEALRSVGSPCVPIPPGDTFEGVSGPMDTLVISQGLSTTAYLNTWSSGATANWCMGLYQGAHGFFLGSGAMLYLDGGTTVNNGSAVALPIAVPAAPAAGQTGSIWVATQDCDTHVIQSIWPVTVETPPIGTLCAPFGFSCDPFGLVCESLSSAGAACGFPPEFGACEPLVGCGAEYACEAGPSPDGGQQFSCVAPCNTTADCTEPDTTCQQSGSSKQCLPQSCGPGTTNGTTLYGPCTSSEDNDGTCIPAYYPAPGLAAVCVQGGSAGLGSACGMQRGGATPLCAPGTACSGDETDGYACAPLCGTFPAPGPDGGPFCDTGYDCVTGGPYVGAVGLFGTCLQDCSSTSCAAGSTCVLNEVSNVCTPY